MEMIHDGEKVGGNWFPFASPVGCHVLLGSVFPYKCAGGRGMAKKRLVICERD